jgi:hypothetical protein
MTSFDMVGVVVVMANRGLGSGMMIIAAIASPSHA